MVSDDRSKSGKTMSLEELQSGSYELAKEFQELQANLMQEKPMMSYDNGAITIDPYAAAGRQHLSLSGNGTAVMKHPVVIVNAPYKGERVQ